MLGEAGVVLHGAGSERVEADIDCPVLPREVCVVANDLTLGHLRQGRRSLPESVARNRIQLRERRDAVRDIGGAAAGMALLEDGICGHGSASSIAATSRWMAASVMISVAQNSISFLRSGHQRPSGNPATMPSFQSFSLDVFGRDRQLQHEFVEERSVEGERASGKPRQLVGKLVRDSEAALGDRSEPAGTHQREIDGRGERAEHLVGADVRCGALAADVLFTRLKGHHIATTFRHDRARRRRCGPASA